MNYAYLVCSDKYCIQAEATIKSLCKQCDCVLLLNVYKPSQKFLDNLDVWCPNRYIIYHISEKEWVDKRMFCKINRLLKMGFEYSDNIFVLDTDLLIQDDIYKVFDRGADVYYTSRDHISIYPINAGVWGFNFNEKSKRFIEFYIDQMKNTTWKPYVDFLTEQAKTGRNLHGTLDWWVDQDFLCVVYINDGKVPFECDILDLGAKYNYLGTSYSSVFSTSLIGNKKYKILHFKTSRKAQLIKLGRTYNV